MLRALRAETMKLKRSSIPLWTALVTLVAPMVNFIAVREMDAGPERVSWTSFMRMGTALFSSWYGILLFGLVAAFLFGREYAEGTAKEMLTLPVRRESFLAAKAAVLAVWTLGLTLLSLAAQAGYAAVLGLRGFTGDALWSCIGDAAQVWLLIFGTLPVVALLATKGRGYLAPMAFSAAIATLGMELAGAGWTRWFPWSMQIGVTGMGLFPMGPMKGLVPGSWVLMVALFAASAAVLVWQVDSADLAQ